MMLAHGTESRVIEDLEEGGFASVRTERTTSAGRTMQVKRLRITRPGRREL